VNDAVDFSELHDELRGVARDLLAAASRDGTADDDGWVRAVEVGWPGLEVPDDLGGSGATFAETAVVVEELGRAATASPYLGTAVLGVGALALVDGTDDRDALLRDVAAGSVRLAVALGPGGDGPDAEPSFRIRTDGGRPRLEGRAEFVIDAPSADRLLVLAVDEDANTVVVSLDPASVDVVDQPVLDATRRFGTVTASDVELDEASVWPVAGDAATSVARLADRAAVAVACDSLGLAAAMLDATVAYVGVRRQFDRPIGSFQAVKHACADMFVQLAVGRELLGAAIEATVAPGADSPVAVSRAKSFVGAASVDVVGSAMQLHGGIGYTWESDVHVYLKRAVLNRALFGSPAAHRHRLAGAIARVEK
jgi:alkylation response protein AidB-like acyl-CoA dehydrogenase